MSPNWDNLSKISFILFFILFIKLIKLLNLCDLLSSKIINQSNARIIIENVNHGINFF